MSLTIKVPIKDLNKNDKFKLIEEKLKKDPLHAYTIMGLMIEVFGVKESAINGKSFSEWKDGLPTLYSRIRKTLEKLEKEGKVKSKKYGKAKVYWWNKK